MKVVCIKAFEGIWAESGDRANVPLPILDEIYTVEFSNSNGYIALLELAVYNTDGIRVCYNPENFRPLDSFGSQVASEIESEMHQLDELIERRLEEIEQLKLKI